MPSIWRESGDPMMRSSSASRAAVSAGRSSARKNAPFDVPPRIHMTRVPASLLVAIPDGRPLDTFPGIASDIFEALLGQALAHLVDIEAQFARCQPLAFIVLGGDTRLGL